MECHNCAAQSLGPEFSPWVIQASRFPSKVSSHQAFHFPSGSLFLQLLSRNGKIALRSYRVLDPDSDRRPGAGFELCFEFLVLALKSCRPPITVAATVGGSPGQAGSLCFVSPRTPPSRTALRPSRTGLADARSQVGVSPPYQGAGAKVPPASHSPALPLSRATTDSFSRFPDFSWFP